MEKTVKKINIAPSSTEGHFVEGDTVVVCLDAVNETFDVKSGGILSTKNHTSISINDRCLITCQNVFDPFKGIFVKSKD